MEKYLVPKETFNCDIGVKTLWQQFEYEVSVEKPEGFGVRISMFLQKNILKNILI